MRPISRPLAPFVRLLVLPLAAACTGSNPADHSGTTNSGDDSQPVEHDTAPPPFDPTTDCDALGMPSIPFVDATASPILYETAADITLNTTDGAWNLKTEWSGCDVYLFVPDDPKQNQGLPYATWSKKKDNKTLIDTMPLNTQIFFLSSEMGTDSRQAALDAMKADVDAQLDTYDADTKAWKSRHIHYVTDKTTKADGWLGEALTSPGVGAGIDRMQRVREIGSMADPTRYDSSISWFDSNIVMVANEAVYYNFEAARQEKLDAEDATIVPAWQSQEVYGSADIDITLPDAATMATFDTLELDMTKLCVGDGEYGACPAWDYLDYVYLCDAADNTVCNTELGRWITTYWREGRWVTDVSPLLGLLKDGGTRRLRIQNSNDYVTTLNLRLSDSGTETDHPSEAQVIYTGGYVSATFNDRDPLSIDVPADVSRVALGVVMTGHGNPGCMEFCGTEHTFNVNGTDNVFSFPITDQSYGCMDQIGEGTVPNQYGTWWYGRDGWCPGKQVDMEVTDITDQVLFGQTNTFNYTFANLDGTLDDGGNIVLNAWLIYYR